MSYEIIIEKIQEFPITKNNIKWVIGIMNCETEKVIVFDVNGSLSTDIPYSKWIENIPKNLETMLSKYDIKDKKVLEMIYNECKQLENYYET